MQSKSFVHIAAVLIFIGLVIKLFIMHSSGEANTLSGVDLTADNDVVGDDNIGTIFLWYAATAIVGGFLFVTYVLPFIGDVIGSSLYSSGEEVTPDPFMKANSKIAQGDYEGAIAEYREAAREEPTNRRPVAEITNLYLDRLRNPEAAVRNIEEALENRQWEEEDHAFFLFRLVDIYQEHLGNQDHAIALLQQVLRDFPDTRHSANATHRLRKIDPALIPAPSIAPPPTPAVDPSAVAVPRPGSAEPPKPNV